MKRICLTLLLVSGTIILFAQKQANNWYFGYSAGITFNTNPPTVLTNGQISTAEGCTSISDTSGNLLFYSDGITVWDSTHAVMQNGGGLFGDNSSTQSGIVLQLPGSSTLYYLITAPVNNSTFPLAYSIIDMTLNGGLGAVTVKNDTLLTSSAEKLTAVYNGNGTDIWILAHGFPNNNFYAYRLTVAGIDTVPVVSSVGNPITISNNKIGYLKASPCGDRLAMAQWNLSVSTLELFDFNNVTGIVSNALQLGQWSAQSGVYGVEFSPDDSKLYASIITPAIVVQFDLTTGSGPAIIASMDTVGASPTNFNGALQTGPDGVIYMTKEGDHYLACIPNPNQPASACGYIENYINLGNATGSLGLPDYFSSFFCNIPSGISSVIQDPDISVFPNPFSSSFTIAIQRKNIRLLSLMLFDPSGRILFENEENHLSNQYIKTFDLNFLFKGIYFLSVNIDGEQTVRKIVKE